MWPKASNTAAAADSMLLMSVSSSGTASARPPAFLISASVVARLSTSGGRSVMAMS
jgi:hypothetical protein